MVNCDSCEFSIRKKTHAWTYLAGIWVEIRNIISNFMFTTISLLNTSLSHLVIYILFANRTLSDRQPSRSVKAWGIPTFLSIPSVTFILGCTFISGLYINNMPECQLGQLKNTNINRLRLLLRSSQLTNAHYCLHFYKICSTEFWRGGLGAQSGECHPL